MIFPFHKFPYSNFHELNLDWILNKLKEIEEQIKNIDIDVDISTDPIIIELQQNVQTLTQTLQQTNQNVQTVLNRVIAVETRLSALEDRVAALEARPEGVSINEISSLTELATPEIQSGTFSPITL